MGVLTWSELASLSLARQFPRVTGADVSAVVETLRRVGPLQTQTARSAFLGLAARAPGLTHATLTEAYESLAVVRGSSLRGTVHTSVAGQHPLLEATARLGQRTVWARLVPLGSHTLEDLWGALEEHAAGDWRTQAELVDAMVDWLVRHEGEELAQRARTQARSLFFSHAGLVRRPLRGGWEGQGLPGYRTARVLLGDGAERDRLVGDTGAAAARVVRLHLASYGPASRHDIAWWSGLGLRRVDAALEALAPELTVRPGPDGRDYWDLAEGVPDPVDDVGTRLLPEFDALVVGYDPRARDRFVDPAHLPLLWPSTNGLLLPPVLHRGQIVGSWRLEGSGRRRRLEVSVFPGCPGPTGQQLEEPATGVAAALAIEVTDVTVREHASPPL